MSYPHHAVHSLHYSFNKCLFLLPTWYFQCSQQSNMILVLFTPTHLVFMSSVGSVYKCIYQYIYLQEFNLSRQFLMIYVSIDLQELNLFRHFIIMTEQPFLTPSNDSHTSHPLDFVFEIVSEMIVLQTVHYYDHFQVKIIHK